MIPKDYACDGQLNMWDYLSNNTEKPKPYEYNFNRFLGREVEFIIQGEKYRGKIVDFDPYYTRVVTDDGSEFACTSSNVYPLPEEETFSCRECDIEKGVRMLCLNMTFCTVLRNAAESVLSQNAVPGVLDPKNQRFQVLKMRSSCCQRNTSWSSKRRHGAGRMRTILNTLPSIRVQLLKLMKVTSIATINMTERDLLDSVTITRPKEHRVLAAVRVN
mgnify:CR=1 FL=1